MTNLSNDASLFSSVQVQFEAGSVSGGGGVSAEVGSLVEQMWQEAMGHLTEILSCHMTSVSMEQVIGH